MAEGQPPAVAWKGDLNGHLELIEQTRLPGSLQILEVNDTVTLIDAIRRLAVRGAPAIGIAAAYGVVLGIRNAAEDDVTAFIQEVESVARELIASRPTAVNLSWAANRLLGLAKDMSDSPVAEIKNRLLQEARFILEEDLAMCRAMGMVGAGLIKDGDGLLTHCNAGGLAASYHGTALGVIFEAHAQGKKIHVFVDETRPLLQGARLTAWEFMQAGIPATLICDNTAAQVFKEGRVARVFVGADRIARNGDAANKVGTYGVAVLARAHDVPFHVVAPSSTFDLDIASGADIAIEERPPEEVTEGFGQRTAPEGVKVYCPAFDVTPANLITSIVTESGIISPVTEEKVLNMLG